MNDTKEFKWIRRYNFDNWIIFLLIFYYHNILLILVYITICFMRFINNRLFLLHWFIILVQNFYFNIHINSNMMNSLCFILSVDMISVLHIMFVQVVDLFYYLLFQYIFTVYIWWYFIMDLLVSIAFLYYSKLGAGICGYYIPNFYSNILNTNYLFMVYVGITNICLMYNPISSFTSSDILILANVFAFCCILLHWIYNGYIFLNAWLYCSSFSTITLTNIYYIFVSLCVDLFYFTFSSILILNLYFSSLFGLSIVSLFYYSFSISIIGIIVLLLSSLWAVSV